MNEMEHFVASTHASRCDIMRYMQQLRDLDERIECHLAHLRSIAAVRVAYQTAQARMTHSDRRVRGGPTGVRRGARQRGSGSRGIGGSSASAAATVRVHEEGDADANFQADNDLDQDDAETVAAAYAAELKRQFAWHEMCVRRQCHERDALAAELMERCSEVRLSLASRLANFASVADAPVTELSG
ncbi:hypothetical protein LSCM1_03101 [Leishmania martiniquensis]|uniref:Uncharacterized protein n=1 Tax=Leishmania martiniquensis TaxID=1580590 RepID=A0A836KHG5_9TRYP|nr:hypothetical protein LSCM1_03101 [Leishmania martiniquensis]